MPADVSKEQTKLYYRHCDKLFIGLLYTVDALQIQIVCNTMAIGCYYILTNRCFGRPG